MSAELGAVVEICGTDQSDGVISYQDFRVDVEFFADESFNLWSRR